MQFMSLSNVEFIDLNSLVTSNKAVKYNYMATYFEIRKGSSTIITGTQIYDNYAIEKAGVISTTDALTTLSIQDVLFRNNSAGSLGDEG